jgi:hypothetical protein
VAVGTGDVAMAPALWLAPGPTDAAADGLEPINPPRSTFGRSTVQCMPAAPATSAAPAIQRAASAAKVVALPSLLTVTSLGQCLDLGTPFDRSVDRIDDRHGAS